MKSFNDIWEKVHSKESWGQYPSEDVVRFVARNYYNCQRDKIKILDYGCGAGSNTWYLAKEKFDVYAFDGSESAINKAENLLKAENLTASFKVSDALEVDYPDNFFDCVVESAVIYANMPEIIWMMYRDIYRMLKIGGRLFTTGLFTTRMTDDYERTDLGNHTYKDFEDGVFKDRGLVHLYESPQEITDILSKCGFYDIIVDKILRTDHGMKDTIEYYMVSAMK